MGLQRDEIINASEEWLVDLCKKAENDEALIGGFKGAVAVIKLSDEVAVKYGRGVTVFEAQTQQLAHKKVDPRLVHIPNVYRFIERASEDPSWKVPMGYLFMEYVSGTAMDKVDLTVHGDMPSRIAKIIQHLGTIQLPGTQIPGPVGGGKPEGYLWGDNGARTTFQSVDDLNAWLNKRLTLRDKSIDLTPFPLVLCHLDLCRRNMILEYDNTICIVDWGSAGFYPRFFEIYSFSCLNPYDEPYETPLDEALHELVPLTTNEKEAMASIGIARAASLRYTFEPEDECTALDDEFYSIPEPMPAE